MRATGFVGDAALTQALPPAAVAAQAYGLAGDRLPYSARSSGSLGIEQDVVHVGEATGFVGADVAYISARYGEFASPPPSTLPRLVFPAYATVNLHAGVHDGQWHYNLFANNVGDKRGIVGGGNYNVINNPGGYFATIIQPRTVGLSVSHDF